MLCAGVPFGRKSGLRAQNHAFRVEITAALSSGKIRVRSHLREVI
jgi:hypothetical protein